MKFSKAIILGLTIGLLSFQETRATVRTSVLPPSNHTVALHSTLKLFNAGDYIMLECKLNGKPAYFMVDTGASFTVLHSKSAKSYDFQVLERKGQQTAGFGGNSLSVKIAIGTKIMLGNQTVSMSFLAQDLSKIIGLVQNESKVKILGIIGTDLLKRLGCSVDIANKLLRF